MVGLASNSSSMGGLKWLHPWLLQQQCAPPLIGPPDLSILWSNWERHQTLGAIKSLGSMNFFLPVRHNVASTPRLVYENGMSSGSVIVDPHGLLGDSFYNVPGRLDDSKDDRYHLHRF